MDSNHPAQIGAIVLAAGISKRMGRQKLLLPWKGKLLIEHVLETIKSTEITPIVVVTGKKYKTLERILAEVGVVKIFNPNFANGSMLESFQRGLTALTETPANAAMIFLGDQPVIQPDVIGLIKQAYIKSRAVLVVPSYQLHRGHPWIIDRSLWGDLLKLREPANLKDYLAKNSSKIYYVPIDSPEILIDIDTPSQYKALKNH